MTAPPPSRHPHPSLPFVTKGDGCPRRPSNSGSGSGRSSASKRGRGGGSGGGGGNEGGAEEEGDDILPFDDDADPPYMDFKEAEEHAMAWVVEVVRLDAAPAALRSMCTAWRADAFLAPGGVDAAALADRFFGQQLALPVTQRLEAVGARRSAWLLAARGLQRAVRAPPEDLARLAVALPVVVHNVAMRAGADAALANGMAPEEAEEDAKAAATFNWFEEESGAMARPPATDKAKSTEMYVRAMFDGAQRSGFALGSDKAVLKQRLTPEGLPTRAWMPVEGPGGEQMDVAAMIATFSRKDVSVGPTGPFRLLCDSYSQNSKAAETLMLRGVDRQFPRLFKSRGLFSFADGLYAAHFRESPGAPEATADRFFPYSARISDLPASAVSANFFDAPVAAFVEARDWREIPTPSFDLIMEHQRWPEEYKALLYVLTGRMMYDVGESRAPSLVPPAGGHPTTTAAPPPAGTMDDWQIFPYLLGQVMLLACRAGMEGWRDGDARDV